MKLLLWTASDFSTQENSYSVELTLQPLLLVLSSTLSRLWLGQIAYMYDRVA